MRGKEEKKMSGDTVSIMLSVCLCNDSDDKHAVTYDFWKGE